MKSLQCFCAPVVRASLAAFLTVTAASTLWAQEDQGPAMISAILIDVKSDSVAEFEAAAADFSAAQEAAGRPFVHVYQRIRGDNLPGFVVFTLDGAYNGLPQLQPDPSIGNRIGNAVNSVSVVTVAAYGELGIDSGNMAPGGEFLTTRVRITSPSNQQAYFDWHENEFTPALREGGVTDLRVGRVIAGGNTNTFLRWSYSDTFPASGGPNVAEAVGQREFQRLLEGEANLIVASEDYILRFREELSFTAEQ